MAKTAAERMAEFRARKRYSDGKRPVEIFLDREDLALAAQLAEQHEQPQRTWLADQLTATIRKLESYQNTNQVSQDFIETLPKPVWDMLDDELWETRNPDMWALLVGLITDGLEFRKKQRDQVTSSTTK